MFGISESGYRALISDCLENGEDDYSERTGIGTRRVFGRMLRFDLSEGRTALITSKRVPYALPYKEKLWMISGQTNILPLLLHGVGIWSDWPHDTYVKKTGDSITLRQFEDRIINDLDFAEQWGDLGPVYGAQWRAWKKYTDVSPDEAIVHRIPTDSTSRFVPAIIAKRVGYVDQLQRAITALKESPSSRRLIVNAWNPAEIDTMALPPCHYAYQFSKMPSGRLDILVDQRSVDLFLGAPFNFAGYALLLHLVAYLTNSTPGYLIWVAGDAHIYHNHFDAVKQMLDNEPKDDTARLSFNFGDDPPPSTIDDFSFAHLRVTGYQSHGTIKAPVAVRGPGE